VTRALPRALRTAVGLYLIAAGALILWRDLPGQPELTRLSSVAAASPWVVVDIVFRRVVFGLAEILIGLIVLGGRSAVWRISIPWAAGVLLFLGSLWALIGLVISLMLLMHSRFHPPVFPSLWLASDVFAILGAGPLIWLALDRMNRKTVPQA
jgi:hypothetical protein